MVHISSISRHCGPTYCRGFSLGTIAHRGPRSGPIAAVNKRVVSGVSCGPGSRDACTQTFKGKPGDGGAHYLVLVTLETDDSAMVRSSTSFPYSGGEPRSAVMGCRFRPVPCVPDLRAAVEPGRSLGAGVTPSCCSIGSCPVGASAQVNVANSLKVRAPTGQIFAQICSS